MRTPTLILALSILLAPGAAAFQSVQVRVVDVGPGLCTITTIPDDHYIVYDAGHWLGRRCIEAVEDIVDGEVIDLMVISHSDSDHLGDADDILRRYDVQRILWTGHRRPGTTNWDNMNDAIADEVRESAASVRTFGTPQPYTSHMGSRLPQGGGREGGAHLGRGSDSMRR